MEKFSRLYYLHRDEFKAETVKLFNEPSGTCGVTSKS